MWMWIAVVLLELCGVVLTTPSSSVHRLDERTTNLPQQRDMFSYRLGTYDLELLTGGERHLVWTIRDSSNTTDRLERRVVWTTDVDTAFVRLANASLDRSPIRDGNYQLKEELQYLTDGMTIDDVNVDEILNSVAIEGQLTSAGAASRYRYEEQGSEEGSADSPSLPDTLCTYRLEFFLDDFFSRAVRFKVSLQPIGSLLSLQPRTVLTFQCTDRRVFGFGESFSHFNLKGRRVPILVSEQGVGRGEQPITAVLNRQTPGVGGYW